MNLFLVDPICMHTGLQTAVRLRAQGLRFPQQPTVEEYLNVRHLGDSIIIHYITIINNNQIFSQWFLNKDFDKLTRRMLNKPDTDNGN